MITYLLQKLYLLFMAVSGYAIVRDPVMTEIVAPEAQETQHKETLQLSKPNHAAEQSPPQRDGQLRVVPGTKIMSHICSFPISLEIYFSSLRVSYKRPSGVQLSLC